ncbi:glycosyltransferase family 4 protein [Elioraea sp.]|uniref:glycosyltransferase family 4 protein n=1 Tax=Elioraea sp. TaxID=2185103 RepID=UPI0025BD66C5|nr:glycosyltransferase family 4 protein [Elioraea sp.]
MRILYSHRIQSRDGQGVHLDSLVAALREAGHEVLLIGPSAYAEARFGGGSSVIGWVRGMLPRAVGELLELAYAVPATLKLDRAAAGFRPDAIYERYNLFHLAGAIVARRRGLPLLLEVNAPLAEERARFGGVGLKPLARWAERFVWRRATRVLPVTEVLAGHVRDARVDPARVVVIPNGIDLEAFPETLATRQAPAGATDLVLGFVGFVRDWHGLDAVVRAIAAHDGAERLTLKVVGEGPARPGLEALAAQLGVGDRVVFTGLAEREAIPAAVAGFDIALQPASVAYASPLKVFEYMAAGRAIVAPDQPNLREVLRDGETALLFDPKDQGEFWRAVARLVADAGLRARLGEAARRDIVARDLTWAGNARRVVSLMQQSGRGADPSG